LNGNLENGGKKMKTADVRKIIKDNSLDIVIKARTNKIVKIYTKNEKDFTTFSELLNGMGYKINYDRFRNQHYFCL
jgi:ApbE superfamily uncharacterized protein (UPF0280 family)